MQKSLMILALPLASFLLSLIPAVGIFLNVLAVHLTATMGFAFSFLDYPMSRRDWPLKRRLGFVTNHWTESVGFGAVFFVPVVNFLITPALVVGATLFFCERQKSDAAEPWSGELEG